MKRLLLICCLLAGFVTTGYAQTKTAKTSDPVAKAKGLQKQLKLTDDQTAKVAAVYKESAEKFTKIKKDAQGNTNRMMPAITPLRNETIKKIKALLTPEQAVKYGKLVDKASATGSTGWSDGWSPAS